MKKSVLLTAVAGSGKSTTCRALQQLGINAHDIETIPGLYELVDERTGQVLPGGMDQITDGVEWRCNKAKMKALIDAAPQGLTIYCGGMSNTDEVWDVFDQVVMLTVSDDTTSKRLATRKQGEFGSTQENREWVLSWKHDVEQGWRASGGVAVSAEKSPVEVAHLVVAATM